MEPMMLVAILAGCMVAVGAGVYVAIQGSKCNKKDDGDGPG